MNQQADSRQADAEIEVTPAMIEAGACAVSDFGKISDERELALRVYTAMLGASGRKQNLP